MADYKTCQMCGAVLTSDSRFCLVCGAKLNKPIYKRVWFWIAIVIVAVGISGTLNKNDYNSSAEATETTMSVAEIQSKCVDAEYKTYARDPDLYAGNLIKISGKVIQVLEGSSGLTMRVAQNDDYDSIWAIVYSPKPGESRILEDDKITIYGVYDGIEQYTSIFGQKISVPKISAEFINID